MGNAEPGFYRGLTNLLVWIVWLFLLPLVLLFGLLIGEVFYWLSEAHWTRVTLCTLGNYMAAPNIPGVNQFVAHELDQCDVSTGALGLDIILNYVLNELTVFLSVPLISFWGIAIFVWLSGATDAAAIEIERRLEPQRESVPATTSPAGAVGVAAVAAALDPVSVASHEKKADEGNPIG
jgi:hypothetical protein